MSDSEGSEGGAAHEECVVEQQDPEGTPEVWSPFEAEYDGMEMPCVPKVLGADGLATFHAPEQTSDIPELSPETLVCMAVCTSFVNRNIWGDIVATFEPAEVERSPSGRYRVSLGTWNEKIQPHLLKINFDRHRDHIREWLKHECGMLDGLDYSNDWVSVEPIRPPCRYYVRQRSHFELNPDAKDQYRLCALRRTTEGAMMSLKDRGMWACDARDPRDLATEKTMDDFDRLKTDQGKKRVFMSIFDESGRQQVEDLAAAEKSGLGVFDSK
jgi:hypothetical protein